MPRSRTSLHGSLTKRQAQILALLQTARNTGGITPSIREIGDAIGVRSTSTVFWHLLGLKDRGLITWPKDLNRAITLVDEEPPKDGRCLMCGGSGRYTE